MPARSQFVLLLALFLSPLARGQDASPEIKLAKPLSWHDHRLEIAIKRVNHSKYRIILAPTPFEGVQIYSTVIQAKSIWTCVAAKPGFLFTDGQMSLIRKEKHSRRGRRHLIPITSTRVFPS